MEQKPNVILIIMDSVRADHLSCYGYHRKTSPNVDRIAKQGVLFENAFSAAPWTPPSHASIFTGKYPSFHRTLGKNIFLKRGSTSLAEILSWNGYQSFGITNCPLLGLESGFNRGFHKYFEVRWLRERLCYPSFADVKDFVRTLRYGFDKNTYRTNELIKSLLKRRVGKKPFFLFVNFFECHTPYIPPKPFKRKFYDSFDETRFPAIEIALNKIFRKTTGEIRNGSSNFQKLYEIVRGKGGFMFAADMLNVSEKEWEFVKSWYDGEIAYLDHRIGELIDFLCREGIFEHTLLIISSDHGENFGEHGLFSHPFCLYDSLLHVPLIISCPDVIYEGRRISNIVSTIDIFPTVLDVLKIEGYRDKIQGTSLYPFEDRKIHDFVCAEYGAVQDVGRINQVFFANPQLRKIDRGLKSIRTKTYKYILSADQEQELYNICTDPYEEINILQECPKVARVLRKQLEKTVDISYFGPAESPASKEMSKRLKALGYI